MTCSDINSVAMATPRDNGHLSPLSADSAERGDKQTCAANAPRGWQSKLARRMNMDRRKVNDVLLGKRTNARVAAAITGAIGIPASQLWPGKYLRLEYAERVARAQSTAQGSPE